MATTIDLTGRRFGRLTARRVEPDPPMFDRDRGWKMRRWLCDCDCGAKDVPVLTVRLTCGNTRSCGCLQREKARHNGQALAARRYGSAACPQCGTSFERTARQKYCSRDCKNSAQLAVRESRPCAVCGEEIPAARVDQSFCSSACRTRFKKRRDSIVNGQFLAAMAALDGRYDGDEE